MAVAATTAHRTTAAWTHTYMVWHTDGSQLGMNTYQRDGGPEHACQDGRCCYHCTRNCCCMDLQVYSHTHTDGSISDMNPYQRDRGPEHACKGGSCCYHCIYPWLDIPRLWHPEEQLEPCHAPKPCPHLQPGMCSLAVPHPTNTSCDVQIVVEHYRSKALNYVFIMIMSCPVHQNLLSQEA